VAHTQKVMTCLWFDTEAEAAATYYTSLLPDSRITGIARYGKNGRMPEGTVLTVSFDLGNVEFMALNGVPNFKFSEASSMVVRCDTQAEIDRLWERLLKDGGSEQQCGWIKDRYGLPWQIVPANLSQIMLDPDRAKTDRVMDVVLKMVKLDMAQIDAAYRGK